MITFNAMRLLAVLALAAAPAALANDFDLSWYTIDGGGGTSSAGDFKLRGTIGQPDANVTPMTGGDFKLRGGFLPGVPPYPLGDLNCDGKVDFDDINPFVMALSDPAAYELKFPGCPFENRDINKDGKFDFDDINPFVKLLSQ